MEGSPEWSREKLERANRRCRRILERLFGPRDTWLFRVEFPGEGETGNRGSPDFTLRLRHPGALRAALLPPTERSAGEAFVAGLVEVDGDLEAAIRAFREAVLDRRPGFTDAAALLWNLLALPRVPSEQKAVEGSDPEPSGPGGSPAPDADAIRRHRGIGNDFYDLWLDPWMQYSAAFFPTGRESLARAQEAKLDMICQMLGLSEGDRVLDVGCGWGGLARYACRNYGVQVVGIALREDRAARARRDVGGDGLGTRCRIQFRDFRELEADESFDRAVSVGMEEHVAPGELPEYYRAVHRALRPGGLFLNVGISTPNPPRGAAGIWHGIRRRRRSFVEAHVSPDGELTSPSERLESALAAGFELRHAENLREHYALTFRHWLRRLEDRWDQATALVGVETARIWRLYMAGSALAFRTGRLGLLHELYAKPGAGGSVEVPFGLPGDPRA